MVKEGYKEVRIGPKEYKFPIDWEIKFFDEITNKITDGTHSTPNYVSEGIPFLSTQNIVPFKDFNFDDYEKYITKEEHEKLKKRCNPKKGDILISKCGTIGRSKLVRKEMEFNIFVGLALLKLNENIRGDFIEQYLNYEPMRKILELNAPGSTRKTLTIKSIKNLRIPLPPLSEQKKIASILSSVDKSIEKTDEVIEETKELKKGLMQELLTKGIGHSEFKEVRIGAKTFKIPETWKLKNVGSLFKLVNGRSFKKDEWVEDGLQIIRIQDLRENDNAETNYCNFEVKDKYYVYNNDLLFCWAGNIKTSLGAYIWNKDKAVLNQHIYNMKPKTNLSKSYYRFLINKFLPLLKNYTGGSAGQVHITKGDFTTFDVPLPPLKEQKKIASILSSVDAKIQKEEEYKTKLERLKKGLMQKLLTGEIRVNTEMEV